MTISGRVSRNKRAVSAGLRRSYSLERKTRRFLHPSWLSCATTLLPRKPAPPVSRILFPMSASIRRRSEGLALEAELDLAGGEVEGAGESAAGAIDDLGVGKIHQLPSPVYQHASSTERIACDPIEISFLGGCVGLPGGGKYA